MASLLPPVPTLIRRAGGQHLDITSRMGESQQALMACYLMPHKCLLSTSYTHVLSFPGD